jgi:hypothetical protein
MKVTDCPEFEGFSEETTAVVVVAWSTTCFATFRCAAEEFRVAALDRRNRIGANRQHRGRKDSRTAAQRPRFQYLLALHKSDSFSVRRRAYAGSDLGG